MLHLVEAMLGRVGLRLVAHMPLAGKIGRVAVLLEEFGDRRRLLREVVLVTRGDHDGERRTDWNAPGHERGAASCATRLAVPAGEDGAFLGDAIDVRCRMAEARASSRIAPKSFQPVSSVMSMTMLGFLPSACSDPPAPMSAAVAVRTDRP